MQFIGRRDLTLFLPPPIVGETIGFTGSRQPFHDPAEILTRTLTGLYRAGQFVTGACTGVDADLGRFLAQAYPDVPQTVIVPAARDRIDRWWLKPDGDRSRLYPEVTIDVRLMPPGTDYRDRNQAIVDLSTILVGYPQLPEKDPAMRRSGSWQTIRMARAKGIPVHVFPLEDPATLPLILARIAPVREG